MNKIIAIKGMNDILPESSYKWLWLESKLKSWLESYGYENIRTPILEETRLFTRSIGEVTDIVEKEMYSFIDKLNNDSLSLRPEGTAPVIRSVLEHNLNYNNQLKLWYIGQMYRHERPQKGRYRQFHQLGVEAIGYKGPEIDTEIILMLSRLWQELGVSNLELQINCLGNLSERAHHRIELINYLEKYLDLLDENAKSRLYKNPLRILDSKNPNLQELIQGAPKLIDYLENDSKKYYFLWKQNLEELNIKYTENLNLVRGLDYYNLSVFEWISPNLGAQSTICAGGRYDPLVKELGGEDEYAIGFAIGIERLLLVIDEINKIEKLSTVDIFIVNLDTKNTIYALKIAESLRNAGFSVLQNFIVTSLKSQLKKANTLKAKFCVIIGENERRANTIMLKLMLEQTQLEVSIDKLVETLKSLN